MSPCGTCDAARDGQCYVAAGRQPIVTQHHADGVAVVQIEIPDLGSITPQHSHRYQHLTMLARGSVRVSCDGGPAREHHAPAAIVIPAGTKHLFETLTPDVLLLCIHNTARSGGIDIIEEHQIVGAVACQ